MNQFRLLSIMATLVAATFLLSNEGGRATVTNSGNTGAPGDQPQTCVTCHNGSASLATTISVNLLDANNNSVTSYMPGQSYTVRVQLDGSGNPGGHGFQMIPLRDSDDTDVKGMADNGTNNYKLGTITNGRTYAEHDGVSSSNTFNVQWTAPASGTGSVTFYAAGNRVNGNGNNQGDGAAATSLTVGESSSSAFAPDALEGKMSIAPNPVRDFTQIQFEAVQSGDFVISVRNLQGQMVFQAAQTFQTGLNTLRLETTDWASGSYSVEVRNEGKVQVQQLLKL